MAAMLVLIERALNKLNPDLSNRPRARRREKARQQGNGHTHIEKSEIRFVDAKPERDGDQPRGQSVERTDSHESSAFVDIFDERDDDSWQRKTLRAFAKASLTAPFLASLMAPISTLLDVPGLTMRWYVPDDGVGLPDPPANVTLSAIGLAFNIIANAALVIRFSTGERLWRSATVLSVLCWWIKLVVALVNVGVFVEYRGPADGSVTTHTGGFWCAVASVAIAGTISILLAGHLAFEALVMGRHSQAASAGACASADALISRRGTHRRSTLSGAGHAPDPPCRPLRPARQSS